MSALDLSSLPPVELNNQKYPVISSASPVICLMLATSGTVCLCQDQKSHSSHVMSAYIKPPPLSPCWLATEGETRLCPPAAFFLPLACLLPFGGALVEGAGRDQPRQAAEGLPDPPPHRAGAEPWDKAKSKRCSQVDHRPLRALHCCTSSSRSDLGARRAQPTSLTAGRLARAGDCRAGQRPASQGRRGEGAQEGAGRWSGLLELPQNLTQNESAREARP